MNIDVIILSNTVNLEKYGMTMRTISTLKAADPDVTYNISVVESNPDYKRLGFFYSGCRVVVPGVPFGYNAYLNEGLKFCSADWVIIANNDLIFKEGWMAAVQVFMKDYPDVKSISPWEPNWHSVRGMDASLGPQYGYRTSYEITGWCMVVHKDVIKDCELFDPQFKFWYQDNDYALTLQKHRIKHVLLPQAIVYHTISGSHDTLDPKNKHEMTDGQLEIFTKKWRRQ